MTKYVFDEKFSQMFKELENDPEYLDELKNIEDGEKLIAEKEKLEERIKKLEHENYVLKRVIYFNCFKPEFYFSIGSKEDNELIGEFSQIMQDFKNGIS